MSHAAEHAAQHNMPHLHEKSKAVSGARANIVNDEAEGRAEAARHIDGCSPA